MKIAMKTPLVEIDGDEMTRVLWAAVKETLLEPFVELKTECYDLSVTERDKTGDRVTGEAAEAILRYGVGVKCATITTTEARLKEYGLARLYPSPNATIRAALDGTVFRSPILLPSVRPAVSTWTEPVVIARHAYGDVYRAAEMAVDGPGKAELVWTGADGSERRISVADMPGGGVLQAMHNLDTSIESFARSCFRYALDARLPLMFAAKDTISHVYDGRFREIFDAVSAEYADRFAAAGITYFYTLIDDAVARVVKGRGGILWACKNYDGDVMSDMVASACGSLAMMRSVLVSPSGAYEFEAAHGTVQRHYYRYLNGEKPSTNPAALIFAWTGALSKRAELDRVAELAAFARNLEQAVIGTIESGSMTADLQAISSLKPDKALDSWAFLEKIAERMRGERI
ncbi:MAG: NADP-dependent isocitrate dehydrogenase [Spirochaetaceae bacterium]|jgi:isocitrate dehydrogenase|nr:NADP-dependent isocitrate dehydrogenase [Spirochaetaceae bacterium]